MGGCIRGSYSGLLGRCESVGSCVGFDTVGGCVGMNWVLVGKSGLVDG